MTITENPAWVTNALRKNWEAIQAIVGPKLMPQLSFGSASTPKERRSMTPVEFGTGHYGTVSPSSTGGVVVKITSDPSEAAFVAAALKIGEFPVGIVRYFRILSLPATHRGRPTFILWRQEARDVGDVIGPHRYGVAPRDRETIEAWMLLNATKVAGHEARALILRKPEALKEIGPYEREAYEYASENYEDFENGKLRLPAWIKGYKRLAILLRLFEMGAEMMENNSALSTNVGAALAFYFERGILLADVHHQNLGRFDHEDYGPEGVVGITDPGHAVFLDDRFDGVTIQSVV